MFLLMKKTRVKKFKVRMFYHLQNWFWGFFVWGVFGLGGFCPGGFCRGVYVQGFFVLSPAKNIHTNILNSSEGTAATNLAFKQIFTSSQPVY